MGSHDWRAGAAAAGPGGQDGGLLVLWRQMCLRPPHSRPDGKSHNLQKTCKLTNQRLTPSASALYPFLRGAAKRSQIRISIFFYRRRRGEGESLGSCALHVHFRHKLRLLRCEELDRSSQKRLLLHLAVTRNDFSVFLARAHRFCVSAPPPNDCSFVGASVHLSIFMTAKLMMVFFGRNHFPGSEAEQREESESSLLCWLSRRRRRHC